LMPKKQDLFAQLVSATSCLNILNVWKKKQGYCRSLTKLNCTLTLTKKNSVNSILQKELSRKLGDLSARKMRPWMKKSLRILRISMEKQRHKLFYVGKSNSEFFQFQNPVTLDDKLRTWIFLTLNYLKKK